jgi:hypothetical protein
MKTAHTPRILRLGTSIALLFAATSMHSAIIRYDASLGSLPTDQGFLLHQETLTGSWQSPVVAANVLHQLPTTGLTYQYWYRTNATLDFATTPYALEWRLHVIDSNYVPDGGGAPGYPRCGYYVEVIDGQGHTFTVGISNERILINNDATASETNAVVVTPFDPRDGFHTYRLLIANGTGTLYVDGFSRASMPVGEAVNPGLPNRLLFGDGSWNGISETELQYLSLDSETNPPPKLSIECSPRICWSSLTNRLYRLQYQSVLTGGAWTDLQTNLVGTGTTLCATDDTNAGQPQRFYRVVIDP